MDQQTKRTRKRYHITQRWLDSQPAPHPSGEQVRRFDDQLHGFGVQISGTTTGKLFFVQRDVRGKSVRRTIGSAAELKVETARKIGAEMLLAMRNGHDPAPRAVSDEPQVVEITLDDALTRYLKAKASKLRDNSIYKYKKAVEHLGWGDTPLREITKGMVEDRFWELTEAKGKTTANDVLVAFRAIWNFASRRIDLPANPATILMDSWHPNVRRTSIIKDEDLPTFYAAVLSLENPVASALLQFLLFTGMRRKEAATLLWDDVDFSAGTITVPAERHKSGGRTGKPFVLPMSREVRAILIGRQRKGREKYVFPGQRFGHPYQNVDFMFRAIHKSCGIKTMAHDLRRTFLTASTAAGVHPFEQKALINHASNADVTFGYHVQGLEQLRAAAQKVADKLVQLCGIEADLPENVVKM